MSKGMLKTDFSNRANVRTEKAAIRYMDKAKVQMEGKRSLMRTMERRWSIIWQ